MADVQSALRAVLGAGLLAMPSAGCGPGEGAPRWMPEDAAMVRCTVSGPHRIQPMLAAVPAPEPPEGMYAGLMHPTSLDELGYQREQVVCASLQAPSEQAITTASTALTDLVELHSQVGISAMRVAGGCSCAVADSIGSEHLVGRCADLATRRGCEVTEDQRAQMRGILAPLREAVQTVKLPLTHWRMAGIADRRGWFLEKLPHLRSRFSGGSEVFVPGRGLPARPAYTLIETLLQREDVIAVVRQNGGEALLVIRELDDELVFDHFGYPKVPPRRRGLVALYESVQRDVFFQALQPPDNGRELALDPRQGNLFRIDRAGAERVDQAEVVLSALSEQRYRASEARYEHPTPLIDRVTVQAPFGKQGRVLVARLELSPQGQQWAQGIPEGVLSPTLDEVDPSDAPLLLQQPSGVEIDFVLRGTPMQAVWIHGVHAFSDLMADIEMRHPSTVAGKTSDFHFDLPAAELMPEAEAAPSLHRLRKRLAKTPHRLSGELVEGRSAIELRLAPR